MDQILDLICSAPVFEEYFFETFLNSIHDRCTEKRISVQCDSSAVDREQLQQAVQSTRQGPPAKADAICMMQTSLFVEVVSWNVQTVPCLTSVGWRVQVAKGNRQEQERARKGLSGPRQDEESTETTCDAWRKKLSPSRNVLNSGPHHLNYQQQRPPASKKPAAMGAIKFISKIVTRTDLGV